MFYNNILIATCGDLARHGSIGASVNQYARWSEAYPLSKKKYQNCVTERKESRRF